MKTRRKTVLKYKEALEFIQLQCLYGKKLSANEITQKYNVGNSIVSYAKQIGYIDSVKSGVYQWVARDVDYKLAKSFVEYMNGRINGSIKSGQGTYKRNANKIKKEKTQTEVVSWFWGLYKKTVTK